MSIAELTPPRPRLPWKSVRRVLKRAIPMGLLTVAVPKVMAIYVLCGLLDVVRNRHPDWELLKRYFTGNGVLTWLLSPFNLLLDLLAVPFLNRGIYELHDLPPAYQEEIRTLLAAARDSRLVEQLQTRIEGQQRVMMFFQWYGRNLETSLDVPEFHRKFKYIRTIGVSVFNRRQSTSEHFGPLRVTLRVLYNLNSIEDRPRLYPRGRLHSPLVR